MSALEERRSRSLALRRASPGFSCCHRCGTPWDRCKAHTTRYEEGRGCFPLCEECWSETSPAERLPYYRQLWNEWQIDGAMDDGVWARIEIAVLQGK